MTRFPACFLFLLLSALPANAQNNLTVPPDAKPKEYSRMIFGQFIEHFHRQIYGGIFEPGSPLADKDGFRTDAVSALKELKIPIVRWPGGCFVSAYHWLDGTGPNRQPAFDKAWGVEDPNTFGTAEFVKWCRLIGAEPYICTNAGSGTPEEMSDWVEYCNLNIGKYGRLRKAHGFDEPFNVRYWSIGNENWGSFEIGAKSPAEWAPFVKESAKMMRATDPNVVLLAAATPKEDWTLPLLQHAGAWLNYVSIHGYYGGQSSKYIDIIVRTEDPEQHIAQTIAVIEKAKLRGKVKIAFDEWNPRGWHHPNFPGGARPDGGGPNRAALIKDREKADINAVYTMADAVFTACFLNTCLRNSDDVPLAGFSPVVNTRGALFVHPKGIVKRTTFHVLSMYANLLEKNVLPVSVKTERLEHRGKTVAMVDAVVTCNDERSKFVVAAVNKSPDKAVPLTMDFAALTGSVPENVQAVLLSGASADDFNDIGAENRVQPVEKTLPVKDGAVAIPPHSVALIKLAR